MTIVGERMKAGELKERVIKKAFRDKVHVIGKLEAVIQNGKDNYFHVHDDEQIPANVGVLLKVR